MSILRVFHGSTVVVEFPNFNHSREDIDFGKGFYVTEDLLMAKKWCCTKINSFVSEYKLDCSQLKLFQFKLDEEWLDFIVKNRKLIENHKYDEYDVLIGPTADDRLYDTLQDYLDGYLTAEQTIRYLNVAGFSNQITLKSKKALDCLEFINMHKIEGAEKEELRKNVIRDRSEAIRRLKKERVQD